ncbi:hypothetical protein ACNKHP_01320 [Shigella boydii]
MRKALENDQLADSMHQPKITWRGEVCSLEATQGWQSPERGLIPPLDFISYAEESGANCAFRPFGDSLCRTPGGKLRDEGKVASGGKYF